LVDATVAKRRSPEFTPARFEGTLSNSRHGWWVLQLEQGGTASQDGACELECAFAGAVIDNEAVGARDFQCALLWQYTMVWLLKKSQESSMQRIPLTSATAKAGAQTSPNDREMSSRPRDGYLR
jgi:hypothetical protein